MNPAQVKPFALSTKPALELISLARLSPQLASQRLRALLLVNPDYFGNVPHSSFKTVLNLEKDTTYESLSNVSYDPLSQQLRATIALKQPNGYSDDLLNNGSQEFVRFFLSYDGGVKWLDQGMRLVSVFDAQASRPRQHEVTLQIIPLDDLPFPEILPKVRAILSWNSPPPTLEPEWTPVWGSIVESNIRMQDSRVIFSGRLHSLAYVEMRGASQPATMNQKSLKKPSTKRAVLASDKRISQNSSHFSTEPQNRLMAGMLAGSAGTARRVIRTLKSLVRAQPGAPN